MREFDDYEDSLRNPDAITHSLPPYTYTNFFHDYPKVCVVTATLFTVAVSMYFWRLFRMQREEQVDDIVRNGRFSHSVLRRIRRRNANESADAAVNEQTRSASGEDGENARECDASSSEEENDHLLGSCTASVNLKSERPVCSKNVSMSETLAKASDEEKDKIIASLGELHGKLATAKIRAKARRLENSMSEEELTEERLIRQKQLESICDLIMQKPEKFGVHDKSEIMEQMKLYSI